MGSLGLFAAAEVWLAGKVSRRLLPKTIECCEGQIRALKQFFGDMPLADFHAGSLRAYQIARSEGSGCFAAPDGTRRPVGASAVNHELGALKQMLTRARVDDRHSVWDSIRDFYAPLREPAWKPPRVYSPREEAKIFEAAHDDPNLELAEIVFAITRHTTASGCELRGLRLRNLELDGPEPSITIPPDATKNDIRPRRIELNEEALHACRRAVERAARLGSYQPHHYLFPFRVNRRLWDPNRRASKSWLRKQSKKLRERTGVEHLRPHNFRHQAVTEMLERGAPEHAVIATAGWVSRKMIEHYYHGRRDVIRAAVSLLGNRPEEDSEPPKKGPRPATAAPATRGCIIAFPGPRN